MTRRVIVLLLVVFFSFNLVSCTSSIFDWLYPDEGGDGDSVEDLIANGDAALKRGEPKTALDYYSRAVALSSPRSSRASVGAARATMLLVNVDIMMLCSKLIADNSGDLSAIISPEAGTLEEKMGAVISYLAPLSSGQCDGEIPATDFEVNMNLMIAYFLRGFLKNGDSNTDGAYFSASGSDNGDIFIFEGSSIGYNANKVNVETLQANIETEMNNLTAGIAGGSVPRATVSNLIYMSHDVLEDLLLVYKYYNTSFDDFIGAATALNRGVAGISGGEVVADMQNEINSRVNEMNSYLNGADTDTANLSTDHLRLVGTNAFSGSYSTFSETSWALHMAIGSDNLDDTGKTNLSGILGIHTGDFSVVARSAYLTRLQQTIEKILNDITSANLINNLMGGS